MKLSETACLALRKKLGISLMPFVLSISIALIDDIAMAQKNPQTQSISRSDNAGKHDEITALQELKQAVEKQHFTKVEKLLRLLEFSSREKTIFEIAKLRLMRNKSFSNPQSGIALLQKIIGENGELKGDAAFTLGKHFMASTLVRVRTQALGWFEKAADWGVVRAHVQLGFLYSRGPETRRNLEKALHHYNIAAETLSVAPIISFARRIVQMEPHENDCGIDPFEISMNFLPTLKKEAAAGNVGAAKELGRLYLNGVFVNRNIETARKWIGFAAQSGDQSALRELAIIDLKLHGDPTSHERAMKLLHHIAERGNGAAYSTLAKMELLKNKPEADDRAIRFYTKSVTSGYFGGLKDLKRVHAAEKLLARNKRRILRLANAIQSLEQSASNYTSTIETRHPVDNGIALPTTKNVDPITVSSINTLSPSISSSTGLREAAQCSVEGHNSFSTN